MGTAGAVWWLIIFSKVDNGWLRGKNQQEWTTRINWFAHGFTLLGDGWEGLPLINSWLLNGGVNVFFGWVNTGDYSFQITVSLSLSLSPVNYHNPTSASITTTRDEAVVLRGQPTIHMDDQLMLTDVTIVHGQCWPTLMVWLLCFMLLKYMIRWMFHNESPKLCNHIIIWFGGCP